MRRSLAVAAVLGAVASVVGSATAGAETTYGPEVNFGTCFQAIGTTGDTSLVPYQAPGQSGNGPLVIVSTPNGVLYQYGSFGGGEGCAR